MLSVPSIVPDISEVSVVVWKSLAREESVESAKTVDPVWKVLSTAKAASLLVNGAAPSTLLGKVSRSVCKPARPL